MVSIPSDIEWYLAKILVEIRVEGDEENTVWINYILIEANLPEEAYEKALKIGNEKNMTYENNDGQQVTINFRGLCDIFVIYEDLEHGAEILYEEKFGLEENEINKLVRTKENLAIFDDDLD